MVTLLSAVQVVLVRPRWASNLGGVARAMKNFGLSRLHLVASRIGSWADAHRLAVHAGELLQQAAQHDELDAALAAAGWVVGTTNRPPAGTRVLTPREVAAEAARHGPPTLLFGGEIEGLQRSELLRCHAVSTIPVHGEQASLNLAQAVCVYAAELFAAHGVGQPGALVSPMAPPAPVGLLRQLERKLGELLAQSRWSAADRPHTALAELLQPLWRAGLTEAEARAWLTAVGKLSRR